MNMPIGFALRPLLPLTDLQYLSKASITPQFKVHCCNLERPVHHPARAPQERYMGSETFETLETFSKLECGYP